MRIDAKFKDELNVGDTLKIHYEDGPDSIIPVQEIEIRSIELNHPRSGDSYLKIDFTEVG